MFSLRKGRLDMADLATKKQHYIKEINKIAKESFNDEQKELVRGILNNATEANIDSVYTFVTQRVKTGFVFDAAPEVAHNCISLCERDNKKSFGNESGVHHKLIIGENYDVLKNLVATYTNGGKGLIDVIYIDPPYNTEKTREDGNDYKTEIASEKFIYRDKFGRTGWLNMMKERLELARKLLSEKGVIFISIDDNEEAYLKVLCDEIFGENNFVGCFFWNKTETPPSLSKDVRRKYEYILCYQNSSKRDFGLNGGEVEGGDMPLLNASNREAELIFNKNDVVFKIDGVFKSGTYDNVFLCNDICVKNGKSNTNIKLRGKFKWTQDTVNEEAANGTKFWIKTDKFAIRYERPGKRVKVPADVINKQECDVGTNEDGTKELEQIFGKRVFDHPKPVSLIFYLVNMIPNKEALVLDFFGGSGTTMQAVMELNVEDGGHRQCILVTNNENNIATDITYERIYRVVNGNGTKKEAFDWIYTDDKPYLTDNYVDVFNTNSYELQIDDYDKAQELLDKAKLEFKKLNPDYEFHELDIYNQLASLKPYKKN